MAPQLPFGRRLDMAAPEHTRPRCQLFAHAPRQRSYLPAELELGKASLSPPLSPARSPSTSPSASPTHGVRTAPPRWECPHGSGMVTWLLLITAPSLVYLTLIAPPLARSMSSWTIPIISIITYLLTTLSFLIAACGDPGFIPQVSSRHARKHAPPRNGKYTLEDETQHNKAEREKGHTLSVD